MARHHHGMQLRIGITHTICELFKTGLPTQMQSRAEVDDSFRFLDQACENVGGQRVYGENSLTVGPIDTGVVDDRIK